MPRGICIELSIGEALNSAGSLTSINVAFLFVKACAALTQLTDFLASATNSGTDKIIL